MSSNQFLLSKGKDRVAWSDVTTSWVGGLEEFPEFSGGVSLQLALDMHRQDPSLSYTTCTPLNLHTLVK